jgi:hypothetical protein
MHARIRVIIFALGTSTALLAGCDSTTAPVIPTGTLSFASPAGGETFLVGDTVTIAWTCTDCTNIPTGDYIQVYAYDGVNGYLVADQGQMSDSVSWVVGSSFESVELLPGTYQMIAQDADQIFITDSRFFQLAAGS